MYAVCIALGIIAFIMIICYMSCDSRETMVDRRKMVEAHKIMSLKPQFDRNNDTFANTKWAHKDLDVVEYFAIRNVFKECESDCEKRIYDILD